MPGGKRVSLNAVGHSGGNAVHVGEVNVHQVPHTDSGNDVVAAIKRTNRAYNLDVGLA